MSLRQSLEYSHQGWLGVLASESQGSSPHRWALSSLTPILKGRFGPKWLLDPQIHLHSREQEGAKQRRKFAFLQKDILWNFTHCFCLHQIYINRVKWSCTEILTTWALFQILDIQLKKSNLLGSEKQYNGLSTSLHVYKAQIPCVCKPKHHVVPRGALLGIIP